MCKHVAAALYGVGARLDSQPELIFILRRVDAKDLVMQAGAGLPKSKRSAPSGKVLADPHLADVFGIEMADIAPAMKPAGHRRQSTPIKVAKTPVTVATTAARKAPAASKTATIRKTAAAQKRVEAMVPAKSAARSRKSATRKAKTGATTAAPKGDAATTRHVSGRSAIKKTR